MKLPAAIMHIYPELKVNVDFGVGDLSDGNGAFIEFWNTDKPEPTQEQLEAAWEEIKDIPDIAPKTDVQILGEQLVQERIERMKVKQQLDQVGKELVINKLELIQLKGGTSV
jgi:XkdW protein